MRSEKPVVISAEKQVRVVEHVEEFGEEFDPGTLCHSKHPRDPKIVVVVPEALIHVAAQARGSIIARVPVTIGIRARLRVDRPA